MDIVSNCTDLSHFNAPPIEFLNWIFHKNLTDLCHILMLFQLQVHHWGQNLKWIQDKNKIFEKAYAREDENKLDSSNRYEDSQCES